MSKVPIAHVVGIASAPLAGVGVAQSYPVSVPYQPVTTLPVGINEAGAMDFLSRNKWPRGLQDAFIRVAPRCPIRYIIVDDSGSMSANDGKRLVDSGRGKKVIHNLV